MVAPLRIAPMRCVAALTGRISGRVAPLAARFGRVTAGFGGVSYGTATTALFAPVLKAHAGSPLRDTCDLDGKPKPLLSGFFSWHVSETLPLSPSSVEIADDGFPIGVQAFGIFDRGRTLVSGRNMVQHMAPLTTALTTWRNERGRDELQVEDRIFDLVDEAVIVLELVLV